MEKVNININPADFPEIKCKNKDCKNIFFKEVFVIKKIPSLITGTHGDVFMPIKVMMCDKCGCIAEGMDNIIQQKEKIL